jgi:hypothetical protein
MFRERHTRVGAIRQAVAGANTKDLTDAALARELVRA